MTIEEAQKLSSGDRLEYLGSEAAFTGVLSVEEAHSAYLQVRTEQGHSTRLPFESAFFVRHLGNLRPYLVP